ncbi:interferon-gamma-inducible GTPase 10-like [Delphinus delphis]|uniref:interferon-gamma-inducible GTPase 10-like n=1 Tax=Delphinus delphis TaxID=9728 RepID=UPI0028C4AC62|nr:interferon-gamma-inducible GTPase 10-like [Delphinus delphis]
MDWFTSYFLSGKNFEQLAQKCVPHYSTLISNGGILSQESVERIQRVFQEGKLKEVVEEIQEALQNSENAPLDVAVIGQSGSGKSSFINALLGLGHEEEGSAHVGVVPTTMKKTPYQHPKYPSVTFWDLPGTGTPNSLPDPYLEIVGDDDYDFFIIISSSRFSSNDALLAQKIKEKGKNFYFVRTMVDVELHSEEKSKPISFKKERVLQQIRDDYLAISNFHPDNFDFPRLQETLLQDLPAHKRYTFVLQLSNLSDAFIEVKRVILKEKIWLNALKSAALAIIPFMAFFSGFDLPKQEKCLNLYRSYFGWDEQSVKEIAQKLGTSVQEIKSSTKSLDFWLFVKNDSIAAKAMKCAESFCSVNGGLRSSVFQFLKVYFLRLKFINTVADDVKMLLHKTLESGSLRE